MPTRYEMVFNDICDKIDRSIYRKGDMLPTEKEMAEFYNVSRITIQKALQILVIRDIVERIPGKGTFLKNVPNKGSFTSSNNFCSLIVPTQNNEMLAVIKSVQDAVSKEEFNLTIHFSDKQVSSEVVITNKVVDDGTKGVIIYPQSSDDNASFYHDLQKNTPLVILDKQLDHVVTNTVLSDNLEGSHSITRFLIEHGHCKIAFIATTQPFALSIEDRRLGYLSALKENQIEADPRLMPTISTYTHIGEGLQQMFDQVPDVTAILCGHDEFATAVYQWLDKKGLKVPDDISVCGFDDANFAHTLKPALTTVAQDFSTIGAEAIKLLFTAIREDTVCHHVVYVPTRIIERDSVKDLRT